MILCFITKGKITNMCRGKMIISKSSGERKGLGTIAVGKTLQCGIGFLLSEELQR